MGGKGEVRFQEHSGPGVALGGAKKGASWLSFVSVREGGPSRRAKAERTGAVQKPSTEGQTFLGRG